MEKEIWKPVPDFEEGYEVSNLGRVRSIDRFITCKNGYKKFLRGKALGQYEKCGNSCIPRLQVNLRKGNKSYTKLVSRLVAKAFIPNPNNYEQVNHIDEDPSNNNVDNLEWCTSEYNHNYGTRNQRHKEKLKKPVNMFTLDHKFIKRFDSIKEAAQEINGEPSSIAKVCKGKYKQHKQYLFEYAE